MRLFVLLALSAAALPLAAAEPLNISGTLLAADDECLASGEGPEACALNALQLRGAREAATPPQGWFRLVNKAGDAGHLGGRVYLAANTADHLKTWTSDAGQDSWWQAELGSGGWFRLRNRGRHLGTRRYLSAHTDTIIKTWSSDAGEDSWWKLESGGGNWFRLRNRNPSLGDRVYLVAHTVDDIKMWRSSDAGDDILWKFETEEGDRGSSSSSSGGLAGYVRHADKNCYTGMGGVELPGPRQMSSAAACATYCDQDAQCHCFVLSAHNMCYKRSSCRISACAAEHPGHWSTYVKSTSSGDQVGGGSNTQQGGSEDALQDYVRYANKNCYSGMGGEDLPAAKQTSSPADCAAYCSSDSHCDCFALSADNFCYKRRNCQIPECAASSSGVWTTYVRNGDWGKQAPSECDQYMATTGCGWTAQWSCPNQGRGTQGVAGNDGSPGYRCCCSDGLWQHGTTSDDAWGIAGWDWQDRCRLKVGAYKACYVDSRQDLPMVDEQATFQVSFIKIGFDELFKGSPATPMFQLLGMDHSALYFKQVGGPVAIVTEYFAAQFGPNVLLPTLLPNGRMVWNNSALIAWYPSIEASGTQWSTVVPMGFTEGRTLNRLFDEIPNWHRRHAVYYPFSTWNGPVLTPHTTRIFFNESVCHSYSQFGLNTLYQSGAYFSRTTPRICRNYFPLIANSPPQSASEAEAYSFYSKLTQLLASQASNQDMVMFLGSMNNFMRTQPYFILNRPHGYLRVHLVDPFFSPMPDIISQPLFLPWQNPGPTPGRCQDEA